MNSRIILAKGINMDRDYNNVLSYSESDMLTLLRSQAHLVQEATDYSFIRGTGQLDTGFTYSQCLQANYIAFQNPDYSNKWFFAWIDDVQYRGNYNTRIIYTIDAWTTWFSDWTAKKCFIKRHHVNNDTIGANLVEENLNIGDVICETTQNISIDTSLFIAVATNWILKELKLLAGDFAHPWGNYEASGNISTNSVVNMLGNIMGNDLLLFPLSDSGITALKVFLAGTNVAGHIDAVKDLYILPVKIDSEHTISTSTFHYYNSYSDPSNPIDTNIPYGRYSESNTPITINTTLNISLNSFSDYTPKNNKCFVYPMNYLVISNNIGNKNILKIEDFANTAEISFDYEFTCSIGASARLIPKNYKGIVRNIEEGIALAKYPTCSWSSDAFTNWLTQNAVNIPLKVGSMVYNLPKPTESGALGSTALNVASFIGTFYEASLLPKIENGQSTGDINYVAGDNDFNVYRMRPKTEFLKIIDDYFTRYGYAIKKLEMPNITGRTYWNYVEIGNTEEIGYGSVPHNFMDTINNACRKGVTIWHSHDNIGNWDLTNDIIAE